MKEYWINVYEKDGGRQWPTRKLAINAVKHTGWSLGKLLYRIHVKMKEPKPVTAGEILARQEAAREEFALKLKPKYEPQLGVI